ncbi:MAG: SH3 domain-containing protein [Alphaproteobacteria bacterium]|nr:SH3 domain-containing protein [Alphaproteobacteria bacterium]
MFEQVRGWMFKAVREPVYGIYCPICAERIGIRATMFTWMRGWWGLPLGPVYALAAIVRNSFGGYLPKDANARILLHQARAFLAHGDLDVARAVADQAQKFCVAPDTRRDVAGLLDSLSHRPSRRLKNSGPWLGRGLLVQISPALAILAVIVGLLHAFGGVAATVAAPHPPQTLAAADPAPLVPPATVRGSFHVSVSRLNVREGPGAKFPVVGALERFTTVEVSENGNVSDWVRITGPGGVSGYVAAEFLAAGEGWKAQRQWCVNAQGTPVANGTLLMRPAGGPHHLLINNTTSDDVVVKLKDTGPDGASRLALYVQAHEKAQADGIPDGTFHVLVATGSTYSRGCEIFLTDMRTVAYPDPRTFQMKQEGGKPIPSTISLTLRPPNSGYPIARAVPQSRFAN